MVEEEQKVTKEIHALEEQKQIFLFQKSRTQKILDGDKKTKLYHTVVNKIESKKQNINMNIVEKISMRQSQ